MSDAASLRVGLLGYGYWGPNLARNFQRLDGFELAAVADLDPSRLKQVRKLYPAVETLTEPHKLLQREDVHVIVVATPVSTHYGLVRTALEQGKHVLVTKPLCGTSAEARELAELAEQKGRILMVDHTFVYSGAVRKIKQLLKEHDLGDLYYFDSVRVNLGLFQSDVNVLWDLAPHDLSILDFLVGRDPVAISAVGAAPVTIGGWAPESLVYVTLRYSDGFIAHIHVNWLSPIKVRRTLIGGSRRMLVYDHLDLDNQLKIYDKGVQSGDDLSPAVTLVQYRVGDMSAPKVDQTEALELECRHLLECIRFGRKPLTDGRAGYRVVRLLELAQESLKNGGKNIPVDLDPCLQPQAR